MTRCACCAVRMVCSGVWCHLADTGSNAGAHLFTGQPHRQPTHGMLGAVGGRLGGMDNGISDGSVGSH
eukprot:3805483-Prorocentrum_lima.AAC.1